LTAGAGEHLRRGQLLHILGPQQLLHLRAPARTAWRPADRTRRPLLAVPQLDAAPPLDIGCPSGRTASLLLPGRLPPGRD
jgi:hypothetical protein